MTRTDWDKDRLRRLGNRRAISDINPQFEGMVQAELDRYIGIAITYADQSDDCRRFLDKLEAGEQITPADASAVVLADVLLRGSQP